MSSLHSPTRVMVQAKPPVPIFFLAFGTRGDVQPLAVLAAKLASDNSISKTTFLTNECHKADIGKQLLSAGVTFRGVSTPPFILRDEPQREIAWQTAIARVKPFPENRFADEGMEVDEGMEMPAAERGSGLSSRKRKTRAEDVGVATGGGAERDEVTLEANTGCYVDNCSAWGEVDDRHREECLKILREELSSSHGNGEEEKKEGGDGKQESGRFSQGIYKSRRALIVFNLFALEAWHLAEYFGVPSVAVAPYVMPYRAPSLFERRFFQAQRLLFRRLKQEKEEEARSDSPQGRLSWREVEHWMWPLFTERWGHWRRERLGLNPCPLLDPFTNLLPSRDRWPQSTPLLYLFSPAVVECPGYWPPSVHITGFIAADESWDAAGAGQVHPPKELEALLSSMHSGSEGQEEPVIYIGFGSMGSMGLIKDSEKLLLELVAALEMARVRGIIALAGLGISEGEAMGILLGGNTRTKTALGDEMCARILDRDGVPTQEPVTEIDHHTENVLPLSPTTATGHVVFTSRPLSHAWLLPRCAAVFHHGGSGTTAAALHAGVPQIICPFLLDQFYWAERMAWIGVAPPPISRRHLFELQATQSSQAGAGQATPGMHSGPEALAPVQPRPALAIAEAIRQALGSTIRLRAAEIGEEIRAEDGLGKATSFISDYLAGI